MLLAILGLVEAGEGRIAVYGDSNCLDSSHMVTDCYWLLKKILNFTGKNSKDPILFSHSLKLQHPLDENYQLPIRRTDYNFSSYYAIIGKDLICGNDSRFDVWAAKGYGLQVRGQNHILPGHHAIDLGSGLNSLALRLVVFPSHWFVPCVVAVSDRQGIEERKEVAPIDKLISGR
ncbi:hypothetical protein Tco_0104643 [Tanacetum coccineum]